MKDVIDALLLAAVYHHGAHVDLDSQILYRSQRSRYFLGPGSAFAGDFCFLRLALRKKSYWRKQGQHSGQPDDS